MSVCSHHWKKKTISFSKCPNRLLIELFGHRRWHQLLFKMFECFLPLIFRVSQPLFCFSWFRSPCPVAEYFISFQMTVLSVAPAGSERFSECIVLPITWRTFADQNKIILFPSLGKQKKKTKKIGTDERIHHQAASARQPTASDKDIRWHRGTVMFVIHVGEWDWKRQLFSS